MPVMRKIAKQKRTETTASRKTYLAIIAGRTTCDDLHLIFELTAAEENAQPDSGYFRAQDHGSNIARDRGIREDQARQAVRSRIIRVAPRIATVSWLDVGYV
jgi:hypothetical protein